MIDLGKLRLFYIVAQEGSVSKAAQRLNTSQPALSEHIMNFEHRLKVKLFKRVPTGMQLTAQGERLYQFADRMFQDLERFETLFYEKDEELQGDIKIITMPYFGGTWLVPHITDFLEKHPKLNIRVVLENFDQINPSGYDVAICPFIPHQSDLIQEELFSLPIRLFASRGYLQKFGTPQTLEDLDHHRLIVYASDDYNLYDNWILRAGRGVNESLRKPYFQIDSTYGLINSALHDLGIIETPDFSVLSHIDLETVLPHLSSPQVPICFTYHKEHSSSKKIIQFKELLKEKADKIYQKI